MTVVRGAGHVLLAVTLTMTMAEFIEVQKLGPEELRSRFGLASTCDPTVTALSTNLTVNQVMVAIDCRPRPAGEPVDRSRPPGGKTRS
jgi:hypothetical protein